MKKPNTHTHNNQINGWMEWTLVQPLIDVASYIFWNIHRHNDGYRISHLTANDTQCKNQLYIRLHQYLHMLLVDLFVISVLSLSAHCFFCYVSFWACICWCWYWCCCSHTYNIYFIRMDVFIHINRSLRNGAQIHRINASSNLSCL